MGPNSWFKTIRCRGRSRVLRLSFFSRPLLRQISTAIVLLSLICATIQGFAQTKEPELLGGGVSFGPTQTSAATSPTLKDKPELVLQTGHTQSVNAVAFSPDNRWLA